jgi:hypothetical protein
MTERNGLMMIKALEVLLPNLYLKPNVLAQQFSNIKGKIDSKLPADSKLVKEAADRLHLSPEAAALRRRNYEASVYQSNMKLREIPEIKVLTAINDLQYAKDWPSLTVCIGLAVGSRLVEILSLST